MAGLHTVCGQVCQPKLTQHHEKRPPKRALSKTGYSHIIPNDRAATQWPPDNDSAIIAPIRAAPAAAVANLRKY